MPISLKMSRSIKSKTRHLKFSHISIFTNLLRTDNETKRFVSLSVSRRFVKIEIELHFKCLVMDFIYYILYIIYIIYIYYF